MLLQAEAAGWGSKQDRLLEQGRDGGGEGGGAGLGPANELQGGGGGGRGGGGGLGRQMGPGGGAGGAGPTRAALRSLALRTQGGGEQREKAKGRWACKSH